MDGTCKAGWGGLWANNTYTAVSGMNAVEEREGQSGEMLPLYDEWSRKTSRQSDILAEMARECGNKLLPSWEKRVLCKKNSKSKRPEMAVCGHIWGTERWPVWLEPNECERKVGHNVRVRIVQGEGSHCIDFGSYTVNGSEENGNKGIRREGEETRGRLRRWLNWSRQNMLLGCCSGGCDNWLPGLTYIWMSISKEQEE